MSGKRLLAVDDEIVFLRFIRGVGETSGFEVETATTASAFKVIYKRFEPTVIVLDIIMPDGDGIELIRWVAAQGFSARMVILSGADPLYGQAAERLAKAMGSMSVASLRKPISMPDLEAALE